MNKIKYTIPLLALIMLIPAGMSNASAQEIPREEDFTEDIGPVGNVGAYVESLKLDESFAQKTLEEQEIYIQSANKFISSGNAYELARNELLIQAGEIAIQVHLTNDEQRLEELKTQYDEVLVQLEEFGVGTLEKTDENPGYYFDKYDKAIEIFEEQGYPATVTNIHTDDVSLSNQAGSLFSFF